LRVSVIMANCDFPVTELIISAPFRYFDIL
jgi:hypothetical protein